MTRVEEKRVREALTEAAPENGLAEERGWQVVREAFAEREPPPRRAGPRTRVGLALAGAALVAGLALTPAGADVRDWIADALEVGDEAARPVVGSLPTEGSVLVESHDGVWVLNDDGSRRRLGSYDDATWSPNGLYVGAARGRELFALTPTGEVRWTITAPDDIKALDWSTDEGYHVAYVAGHEVRVVAGDGTSDGSFAEGVGSRAVAWRPESVDGAAVHELAYVDPANQVVLADTDTGEVLWRSEPVAADVGSLQWSADGTRLLIGAEGFVLMVDQDGRSLFKGPIATGSEFALSPDATTLAVVRPDETGQAELVTIGVAFGDKRERVLYPSASGAGGVGFDAPTFSPDGEWILLPWPQADQWIFVRIADRRVVAVADMSRQLDANGRGTSSFPRVAGWCC